MKLSRLLAVLFLLLFGICSAQTTQNFSWSNARGTLGSQGHDLEMNVPDTNTTALNILAANPQGLGGAVVYAYTIASGPALVIGEWVDIRLIDSFVGTGIFRIVSLGTDSQGRSTFTTTFHSDSALNSPGSVGYAGPSMNPILDTGKLAYNWYPETNCLSDSVFNFTLLHADGTLTNETSTSASCTITVGYGNVVNASVNFSGTLTSGQSYTGTAAIRGYIGRYGKFTAIDDLSHGVPGARWSITTQ